MTKGEARSQCIIYEFYVKFSFEVNMRPMWMYGQWMTNSKGMLWQPCCVYMWIQTRRSA